jgi:transposase
MEGVLWVLQTGAPWRDLPTRFGPWQTVYGHFRCWVRSGCLDRVLAALQRRALRSRRIVRSLWCVDTTVIRASRSAGGAKACDLAAEPPDHALGRSRGGLGTKLTLVCDEQGTPLSAALGPGQEHDIRRLPEAMERALGLARPQRLTGDKAYSVAWVRAWLRGRRIQPVIPSRKDQRPDPGFDREQYRKRNVVERLVSWLKESRRVATRYEKLAVTYLAMVKLAMIRRVLRKLEEFSDKA